MDKIKHIDALVLTNEKKVENNNFLEKFPNELEIFENIMISTDKNKLEGIFKALLNCNSGSIFITSCALQNLTERFISFILQFNSRAYDAIIVRDKSGKTYPHFGIYNKSALNVIECFLLDKNYRLQEVLIELNVKYISLENTEFDSSILLEK
ncbi:MAG: hypothetical protein ACRC5F_09030 [Cetobacterium sp.]